MCQIFQLRNTHNRGKIKLKIGNTHEFGAENEIWGLHLNFVQQVLCKKTPDWLKLYAGPTINVVNEVGYGGILGTEIKLIGRLKFDMRYEYTNQTNRLSAGLIFKYQKKYLWQ
ncbi:MAG: hypothetical protein ACKO5C_06655 [Ferruginibacter sp.]